MALKIGNLSLDLKKITPKTNLKTPCYPIERVFSKNAVIKIVEAARVGRVQANNDEVSALTAMLSVFDSPLYDSKVAISGSPEMVSITTKAVPIFNKLIVAYWERNVAQMEFSEDIEKEVLMWVSYLKDYLSFFVNNRFKPSTKTSATIAMKSMDYLLNETQKLLSTMSTKKVSTTVEEVWQYLQGVLSGIFKSIQHGRKAATQYVASATYVGFTIKDKYTSAFERGENEFLPVLHFVQASYAEKVQNASKADPVQPFIEEAFGEENGVKSLYYKTFQLIFDPKNFGTEEQLIENVIEESNEEFQDTFEGTHRNKPASQSIEITEPTPTKKGK